MKRETDSRLIKATANSDLLAEDKEERDKHKELQPKFRMDFASEIGSSEGHIGIVKKRSATDIGSPVTRHRLSETSKIT